MCYKKFHTCRYCNNEYECKLKNYICPTINADIDKNMCDVCRQRIEKELNDKEIAELLKDEL